MLLKQLSPSSPVFYWCSELRHQSVISCNTEQTPHCRRRSWLARVVFHPLKNKGDVTSCTPLHRQSLPPAAPVLVSSPSAPVCISARWSASDEPSVGSYLVRGETGWETERSQRRTDKERERDRGRGRGVKKNKVSSQTGLKLYPLQEVSGHHFWRRRENVASHTATKLPLCRYLTNNGNTWRN